MNANLAAPFGLTDRQLAFARLAASGMYDEDIAIALGVTPVTVRNMLVKVRAKTQIQERSQLAVAIGVDWRRESFQEAEVVRKFLARVDRRGVDECWPFTGGRHRDGRGALSVFGRNITAPRLAWLVEYGVDPPDSMMVCHSCDNPPCCNPRHLWLGTCRDNAVDAARKGRLPSQTGRTPNGSRNAMARLHESEIPGIRAAIASGESVRSVARRLGMSVWPISRIANGEGWKHVARIALDKNGKEYVIGDASWNVKGRPVEYIELAMSRGIRGL